MNDKVDFSSWNECMGRVITHIDRPSVLGEMLGAINEHVPFDFWYVAFFRRDAPPLEVDYSYASSSRETYAEGPYLLCPFYNAFLDGLVGGCYTLKEFAPPDFKNSEYYLSYYAPEVESSEVAFNLPMDDNTAAHVSISRSGRAARFSAVEMRFLDQVAAVVNAVMDRIWQRTRLEAAGNQQFGMDFHMRMTHAFRKFGTAYLTDRESEITHLLLRGHSAKSIARLLDISPGTVRNHMKSIYIKLEISSQSELFGLFFESLSHVGSDITVDPLEILREPER
jgi:DNA-binding CsgD family transcriptional regulator